ncbi:MAG: sigma-70 family RNA polymerase sigma factor [bacterium]|nr:sigma-70 family RNA polymerase sigma factor [bacterium]
MTQKTRNKTKREEFSQLYSQYYPLVFNTVYSKTGNRDDAYDISQEIFIIYYEKFEKIGDNRKWLFGVLRNVVLRHYSQKSNTTVDIDSIFEDVSLTFVNGFRDTRIIIEEAIENIEISEEDRTILEYIAYNNYSYTHVGSILGMTKRQVGYRYLAIVKKILEVLREKGIQNIEDLL